MTGIKTIDEFDFGDKTVLVRVDFNSPIDPKTKDITDDTRIRLHAKTIRELMDSRARVVILAHQGRSGRPDFSTLEKHAAVLSEILGRKVGYVDDIFGERARRTIKDLKPGEALILENVRTYPGERVNKTAEEHAESELVASLAPLADVYVGDGFAVSHRSHASVVGFSPLLPCIAGRVMERELLALSKVRRAEEKPCVYVLGGAKADDAAAVCQYVFSHETADYVLTGGVIGHLFLHSKGVNLGEPTVNYLEKHDFLQYVPKIQELLRGYGDKILTPIDLGTDAPNGRESVALEGLPCTDPVLDIGSKTIEQYEPIIERAKIIVLSGPMGVYERQDFMLGTEGVFKAIAGSNAFSVAGGGNTIEALEKLGLMDRISYISTGGGALMEYLTGSTLPGVKALEMGAP